MQKKKTVKASPRSTKMLGSYRFEISRMTPLFSVVDELLRLRAAKTSLIPKRAGDGDCGPYTERLHGVVAKYRSKADYNSSVQHFLRVYDFCFMHSKEIAVIVRLEARTDASGKANYESALAALSRLVSRKLGSSGFGIGIESYDNAEIRQGFVDALLKVYLRFFAAGMTHTPTGHDFEGLCAERLEQAGAVVERTKGSGDFGVDLLAREASVCIAIQCKGYAKAVGVKAVQEVVAGAKHYRASRWAVCSASGFSDAAIELAATTDTLLCSPDNIHELIGGPANTVRSGNGP